MDIITQYGPMIKDTLELALLHPDSYSDWSASHIDVTFQIPYNNEKNIIPFAEQLNLHTTEKI